MKSFHLGLALVFLSTAATAQELLPTDVTVLTEKDFAGHNYFSVGDALRGVTSIKLEQDGSRGTRTFAQMRGMSGHDNVLVLLDGRPLNHEYDSQVDLTQFPLGMVDRIEITRGGAPSAYSAQAIAGTINVITIRPEQRGLVADMGTGVGRDGEKNVVGKLRGRTNLGDLTYAPSKEYSGGFSHNENFETTNHFANVTRSFNGKGYWGAEYYYHTARVGVSNGTPIPFDQWDGHLEQQPSTPYPTRSQVSQHAKAMLASPLIFGGTTYATFTQSWRVSNENASREGPSLRHVDGISSTMDVSWRGPTVEAGFQGRELERQIYPEDAHNLYENGVYATARWKTERLLLAPGVRYEHNSRSGDFFAPRLAAAYSAGKSFLISATGQRAHRPPSFEELFNSSAPVRNGNLNDENSWNGDLGFHWTPAGWFGLKSTGFLIRKKDVIATNPAGHYENGGVEKSRGVETEMILRIGGDKERVVELSSHWTVQDCQRSVPTAATFTDAAMVPRHLLFIKLDKHFPHRIVLSNEIRYQSEQFEFDNQQGLRVPSFYVWNARLALKILAADLYFAIDNISRRRYAETIATAPLSGGGTTSVLSPQPERTYWAGVSIRFIN